MRNHAQGTREQECYQFENIEDFRSVINARYRLVPYLYSEYMKAALNDDMYFKPLGFVYPDDKMAIRVEDQLMLGNEIMIAPVYEQNARGRYVYLPEEMKFVKFLPDGSISEEILERVFIMWMLLSMKCPFSFEVVNVSRLQKLQSV